MKILHWNIHGWTDSDGVDNVDRVIDLIREQDPDVVSLVEVDEEWGSPAKLQRVSDTLGYSWAFVPAFEYREAGGFGNALLSKQPFTSVQQWQLLPPSLYDGSEASEPRSLLIAKVGAGDNSLTVGSTHLPRSNVDLRTAASKRFVELVHSHTGPFVFCGDFNRPSGPWLPEELHTSPEPTVATYPVAEPREAIDYFVSSMPLDGVAIADQSSDHLPIVARNTGRDTADLSA